MFSERPTLGVWLMLLPLVAVMAAVIGWPLIDTLRLSMTDARLVGSGGDFVGFDNFSRMLQSRNFQNAFWITLRFTVISVSAELVLGVLVALLLNERFFGRNVLRAMLILPWALPTVVNAMLWRLIYNPEYGALNALLTQLGLTQDYRSWLGEPDSAMIALIVADVWKNFSLVALIALAALQSVPAEIRAAAISDGANVWRRFRYVTMPYLMGPLLVALVLRTIEAFKVFDLIWVMTRGGPANTTRTLSILVYQEGFAFQRAGSGASLALIVTLMITLLALAYMRLIRRFGGV